MICVHSVPFSSHVPSSPLCPASPPLSFTLKHWCHAFKPQWSSNLQSLSFPNHLTQLSLSICTGLAPRMTMDSKIQGCSSPLQSTLQTSRTRVYWGPTVLVSPGLKLRLFSLESSCLLNFTPNYLPTLSLLWQYLPSQRQDDGPESQNDIVMNPRSCANALIWFLMFSPLK